MRVRTRIRTLAFAGRPSPRSAEAMVPPGDDMIESLVLLLSTVILVVGYSQWRIANSIVMVDLFARRFGAYNKIRRAITSAVHRDAVGTEEFNLFSDGKAESEFLFGGDVSEYLQTLHEDFAFLHTYTQDLIDTLANRDNLNDVRMAAMLRVNDFFQASSAKFAPYMRMHQKNAGILDSIMVVTSRIAGKILNSSSKGRNAFAHRRSEATHLDFPVDASSHRPSHL